MIVILQIDGNIQVSFRLSVPLEELVSRGGLSGLRAVKDGKPVPVKVIDVGTDT